MGTETAESQQDEAYRLMRKRVVFLTYKPGEKLAMKHLCEDLGFGRTPIRAAIQQLQKEGLVKAVPQSGTYVTKIDMQAAESARFVREIVEKEVAGECAALATRADIDRIDRSIEMQRRALESHEYGDFFITDNLMHQAIFDIAGRGAVWDWLNNSNADLERYRLTRVMTTELDWDTILDEHLRLRDTIMRHDTTEARYLTALHLHMMLSDAPKVVMHNPDYFA